MFAGFTVFYMKMLIFTKPKSGGGGGGGGVGGSVGGGGWGGCEPRIEVILKMQRMQKRRGGGTVGECEPRIEVIPEYHSC